MAPIFCKLAQFSIEWRPFKIFQNFKIASFFPLVKKIKKIRKCSPLCQIVYFSHSVFHSRFDRHASPMSENTFNYLAWMKNAFGIVNVRIAIENFMISIACELSARLLIHFTIPLACNNFLNWNFWRVKNKSRQWWGISSSAKPTTLEILLNYVIKFNLKGILVSVMPRYF